jgi:hypothetical protein
VPHTSSLTQGGTEMRKLLVAAVGLVTVLAALPVYAVDVNFSGEFRVRAFWNDNLFDGDSSLNDSSRFDDLRFRLKTSIKAGVSTGVVVLDFGNCLTGADSSTFQNGTVPGGFAIPTGDCRFGTAGTGGSYNVVGVREAYLKIDLSRVGLLLGRQTLKLGHGIILDDTADAITVVLPMGSTTISASMVQLADPQSLTSFPTTTGINQDSTIWLVNVGMDHGNHLINLYDAFLYDQGTGTTVAQTFYPTIPVPVVAVAAGQNKIWVNYTGLSLDAKNGPMALAFEGTYDFGRIEAPGTLTGSDTRLGGYNLMGDATVDTGGAKVGGTIVYASGQENFASGDLNVTDISGNFQLGNIILNHEQTSDRDGASLGGGMGGAGIFAVKLHADMMPSEKLTVGGAVIYAQTTEEGCSLYLNTVSGGAVCPGPINNRLIGYELDANAKYKVDDNLIFAAGVGYLITGSGAANFYGSLPNPAPPPVYPNGPNSNIWKLSAKAVFTF